MKLREVYEAWIPVKKRQVKTATLNCYKLIYIKVLDPEFGQTDVETINKKVAQRFIYRMLDSKERSKKYCSDILILLKMLIRFAGDELDVNIPDTSWKITWPTNNKIAPPKIERYTVDEYQKIVNYAINNPSPRNLGILLTISSGMRIGEICALQWKDIDLVNKTIHVNKTIERIYIPDKGKTTIEIGPPKTSSSDRYIPILKSIFPIVKKFSAICKPEYYVCSCQEYFIEPRTFRDYYNHFILNKAGLKHRIKFHGLRHTFASTLIENKVNIKTVSAILGHSDISTTLNVYVHPSDKEKNDAVNTGLKRIFK